MRTREESAECTQEGGGVLGQQALASVGDESRVYHKQTAEAQIEAGLINLNEAPSHLRGALALASS